MPELRWFTWGQPGSPTETGNINRILLHIRWHKPARIYVIVLGSTAS